MNMDSSSSTTVAFDNVKFEKAKALARYNRFRKISRLLQCLEVLVAVALISWSSTRLPGALKLACKFLLEFARYVCNPHVVFLIGNAIVAVLFLFRRENNDSPGNDNSGGDLYDEYVRHRQGERKARVVVPDEIKTSPLPAEAMEVTDVVVATENSGGDAAEEKQMIVCVQCDPVTAAIETATKQIEKFQRTQSVTLKRESAVAAELRRSETVKVGRSRAERQWTMTPIDRVDKLSDEEFNMTIEAYIKRHRESLMEQKIAENEELQIRKN